MRQHQHRSEGKDRHNQKLCELSREQEKTLFSVSNTVKLLELDKTPPAYVLDTLSLGPRNPVLNKFEPKDILVELDSFLSDCKKKYVAEETLTDINVKTLNYIKKCKQLKSSRNIMLTRRYLKENNLLAVPFDKGVGICLMKKETYHTKMNKIINLPQFEKVTTTRKNAKHPVIKEEERVTKILKARRHSNKISEDMYEKLRQ